MREERYNENEEKSNDKEIEEECLKEVIVAADKLNRGDFQEAKMITTKALQKYGGTADLYKIAGMAEQLEGNKVEAIRYYEKALEKDENCFITLSNIGMLIKEKRGAATALKYEEKAYSLNKGSAELLLNLGNSYKEVGEYRKSKKAYEEAIALNPRYSKAYNNLGNLLMSEGELDDGLKVIKASVEVEPECAQYRCNLGCCHWERGEIKEAETELTKSLAIAPDNIDAVWNMGLLKLIQGDYETGLKMYEARKRLRKPIMPHFISKQKEWKGESLEKDQTLTVIGEQSISDILHFVRYYKTVKSKVLKTKLVIPSNLHKLVVTSKLDEGPIDPREYRDIEKSKWVSLMTLPLILGVTKHKVIEEEPYLKVCNRLKTEWKNRLSIENKPIIGLYWQGDPKHEIIGSRGRSIELESLKRLSIDGRVKFVSLQKGKGSEQLLDCSFKNNFVNCQSEVDKIWDLDEIAAVISNCDLVVTVDTIAAQLAAALGKETWLLLRKTPDWRWGLKGRVTSWYKTMKLFRQRESGEWEYVIEQVVSELSERYK